jgi:hypothetical protein
VGSTAQHEIKRTYRPEQAQHYIEQNRWSEALEACDGMLNGSNRTYFSNPEVWGMQAEALVQLGRLSDAEWSIKQAMELDDRRIDTFRRYLRQKHAYFCSHGKVRESDLTLAQLVLTEPLDNGIIAMLSGRVRFNAGTYTLSRGVRDAYLADAVQQFAAAESFWTTDESINDSVRLENYILWFLAIVNQSRSSWGMHDVSQILGNIAKLDPTVATELRRKLRYRKLLGFRIQR